MNGCSVSIIIPAYNSAVSLARSIDSALAQTAMPEEIIVINDGSTDNTAQVAKAYSDKIVYIEQENLGQGAARNTGLKQATKKYVAFLDADDYWLPEFLMNCVQFLEEYREAIAVGTGQVIKLWGKKDLISPPILTMADGRRPKDTFIIDDFFGFWAEQDHIRTGSNLIRRDIIERAGYQLADLRISQDLEYWGFLATYGKWGFIPKALFVTDGTSAAASVGWAEKYKARRRKCPDVEQWQRRIVPRLRQEDWPGFEIVRGRVAKNFAHSKILAGNDPSAYKIVLEYGNQFPRDRIAKLLRLGASTGIVGWKGCCYLLRLREWLKSLFISMSGFGLNDPEHP
jgi:glycosyltransferase involved in cell wall biosynthesis